MKQPLVTIGIPAYNHEKFVAQAIESVLKQTYKNIEFIIVNDGSTDNTHQEIVKYIDKCKERFVRFKYINRNNKGLTKTLNEMIEWSNGKYFKFFASDDIIKPHLVEKCVNYMESNQDISILYFYLDLIDENGKILKKNIPGIKGWGEDIHNIEELNLYKALEYNRFYEPANFFRTEVFKIIGNFDEKIGVEDWDFMLKVLKNNLKIGIISDSLILYRQHKTNSYKNIVYILENNLKILEKYQYIPGHKKRIISVIKSAYIKIFLSKEYNKKDIKFLFSILKNYEIPIYSLLIVDPKFFFLLLYINMISLFKGK